MFDTAKFILNCGGGVIPTPILPSGCADAELAVSLSPSHTKQFGNWEEEAGTVL